MKKKVIWGALLAVLVAAVFLAFRSGGSAGPKYRTAKVDRGDVTQTVTATGALSAVTTVKVGSQVSGIVATLFADFNTQVKKGQLLAELDPTPFKAKVDQSQGVLDKAKVDRRNADINLRRQQALMKEGLAPQADLDQAQANYDGAVAAVEQAEAALKQAKTDLEYTKIVAPIDGTVVDREYDVGQTVAASFQAPMLFQIAQDLTKMQVSADVSESDIGGVKVGQPVRFTVDAFPDRVFRGTVSQVRLFATVNQNVVTYPVIIQVPNPDLDLKPTMTANVSIDVATIPGTLRVPNAALRWRPEGVSVPAASSASKEGQRPSGDKGSVAAAKQFATTSGGSKGARRGQTVYTMSATGLGEPKPVEVRAGITDGRFTQIAGGDLKEGDVVVVGLATTKADVGGKSVPGMSKKGF